MDTLPLRVGIIGCGGITAFAHLPTLCRMPSHQVEVRCLCDTNIGRAETLKQRFNLQNAICVQDYEKIVSDSSTDAIIVASWPSNHAQIAIEAIESGKHVLIQKPLSLSDVSADKVLAASRATTACILALPLIDAIRSFNRLRAVIDAGILGSVRFARIRTTVIGPDDYYDDVLEFFQEPRDAVLPYFQAEYARKCGSIVDMGPYALTAFHYLFGPGKLLFSYRMPTDYDKSALLVLEIPRQDNFQIPQNEAPYCSVEIGWQQVRGVEICSVFGSNGTACVEATGRLVVFGKDGKASVAHQQDSLQPMLPASPIRAQDLWVEAILSGKRKQFRETVESAVWVSRIIDQVVPDTINQ